MSRIIVNLRESLSARVVSKSPTTGKGGAGDAGMHSAYRGPMTLSPPLKRLLDAIAVALVAQDLIVLRAQALADDAPATEPALRNSTAPEASPGARTMAERVPVPGHVLKPGATTAFVAVAQHDATHRAGLGYAILRALGAHERLGPLTLDVVARWSADYGTAHGGVTPDAIQLSGQAFEDRVGRKWRADKAAPNAACYPGGRQGRPSYAAIYHEVWAEQRWPELCETLSGRPG